MRTISDDPPADKYKCEDDIENTQRTELIGIAPGDYTPIGDKGRIVSPLR